MKYVFPWGKCLFSIVFPARNAGSLFSAKRQEECRERWRCETERLQTTGILREKSHGEAAEGQDGGRPAKQGDFRVESAGKEEKMGPWAAKISMEEVSAAEAAKRRGQKNDCVEIRQNKTFHSTMCDIILCLHSIYVWHSTIFIRILPDFVGSGDVLQKDIM